MDRKNSLGSCVVPASCSASSRGHQCTSDNFPQTNFSNTIGIQAATNELNVFRKENVTESCGDPTTVTSLNNNIHYPPRYVENALRTETIANGLTADESNSILPNLKKENTSDSDNTQSLSVMHENGILPISRNTRNADDMLLDVKTENNDFCDNSSTMTITVENNTNNVKTPSISDQTERKSPSPNHPCSYEKRNIPHSSEVIENKGNAIIKEMTLKVSDSNMPVYCLTPTDATETENAVLLVPIKPLCTANPLTPTETTPNSTLPDTGMKKSSNPYFVPASWTTPRQELQHTTEVFAQNHPQSHPSNSIRVCSTISDNSKELPWTSENFVLNHPYLSKKAKRPSAVGEHLKSSQMNRGTSQDQHSTVENLAQSLLPPSNSISILKRTANQNLVINQMNNDLMHIKNVYSSTQSIVPSTGFIKHPSISHQFVSILPPKPMKMPSLKLPCSDGKSNLLQGEGTIESNNSTIIKEKSVKITGFNTPIYCLASTDRTETENVTLLVPVKPLCATYPLNQQVMNDQNSFQREISDSNATSSLNIGSIANVSGNIKDPSISENVINAEPADKEATCLPSNIKKGYSYAFPPLSLCPTRNMPYQPGSKENVNMNTSIAEEFRGLLSDSKKETITESFVNSSMEIPCNEDINCSTGGVKNSRETEIILNDHILDESQGRLPNVRTENTSDSHNIRSPFVILGSDSLCISSGIGETGTEKVLIDVQTKKGAPVFQSSCATTLESIQRPSSRSYNVTEGNNVLYISSSVVRTRDKDTLPYMKTESGDFICQETCVTGNDDDHCPSNNAENSTIHSENIGQKTDLNGAGDENSVLIASDDFEQSGEPKHRVGILNNEIELLGHSEHNILRGVIDVAGNESSQTVQFEDISDYTRSSEAVGDGDSEKNSTLSKLTDKSVTNTNVQTMAQILEPLYKHIKDNKCLLCGFESKSNNTFRVRRHLITHLDTKNFKCDTCGKLFKTPRELSVHKDLHSDVSQTCLCETCGKTYPNKALLSYHQKRHKPNKSLYTCTVCNKQCSSSANLKSHYRLHTGEKPYACVVCNKTFRTNRQLNNHALHHNDKKLFPCDFCDKAYNRRQLLNQHMNTHKDSPAIKCSICEKSFNYKSNLAQHMLVHSDARRHTCETCGMKFKLPHHLRSHIDTHH